MLSNTPQYTGLPPNKDHMIPMPTMLGGEPLHSDPRGRREPRGKSQRAERLQPHRLCGPWG